MAHQNTIARRRLDQRFDAVRPAIHVPRPHRGWIRAIRDALGMSGSELADRMGISPKTVYDIEQSEMAGTIKLETLQRAADALDCDLEYVLVPRHSLDSMVHDRARVKARVRLDPVAHHSRLEDQAVSEEILDEQVEELAGQLVDRRGLWGVRSTA